MLSDDRIVNFAWKAAQYSPYSQALAAREMGMVFLIFG
jgi:hypothetical protein